MSFTTVTELRYGALKAGWGELRRRGLERDLARLVIVQPDDRLMQVCAELRVRCDEVGHALGQKVHEADSRRISSPTTRCSPAFLGWLWPAADWWGRRRPLRPPEILNRTRVWLRVVLRLATFGNSRLSASRHPAQSHG